ncbi:MAG: hypothetical protein Q9165_002338 [Trypethelium subeluteriae]
MADEQKELQALSDDYQNLQTELQSTVQARQKLGAQEEENKGVQKEFTKLADDAGIYKLVGPVLLKQDNVEATMAVDGRLDYITKEMSAIVRYLRVSAVSAKYCQKTGRRPDCRNSEAK